MRVLVIGATGFIGRAVVARLVAQGHDVRAVVRSAASAAHVESQGASAVPGDLSDAGPLAEAAAECDATVDASHLRGLGAEAEGVARAAYARLLAASAGRTLLMTTGAGLIGDTGSHVADETTPALPGNWRADLERAVVATGGVRGIVVRPGLVHGLGGSAVVEELVRLAVKLQAGWCVGHGQNRWSAVHVEDLADLYMRLLESQEAGIFHAAAEDVSMRELAHAIAEGAGYGRTLELSLPEARAQTPMADLLTMSFRVSSARAAALGWQPTAEGLVEALRRGDYVTAR